MFLAIYGLMGNIDINKITYMLTSMSFLALFSGLHLYEQDRTRDGIMVILSSIFCLGAVIKIVLL